MDLGNTYLEQTGTLNSTITESLEKLATSLGDRHQNGAAAVDDDVFTTPVVRSAAHASFGYANGAPAAPATTVLNGQYAGELRATLEELRETIRGLRPFLDQVADNLRRHADDAGQPMSIRVRMDSRRSVGVAAD